MIKYTFFRPITKIPHHFITDRCVRANFTPKRNSYIPPPMSDIQYTQFLYKWFLKCTLHLHETDEISNDFAEDRWNWSTTLYFQIEWILWLILQIHHKFYNKSAKSATTCQNINFPMDDIFFLIHNFFGIIMLIFYWEMTKLMINCQNMNFSCG